MTDSAGDLLNALNSEKFTLNNARIVEKIKALGEIAKTLSLVYQIESMRAKAVNKDANLLLPEEQLVEDPAIKRAQKAQPQFKPGSPNDLTGFRSPGGWVP